MITFPDRMHIDQNPFHALLDQPFVYLMCSDAIRSHIGDEYALCALFRLQRGLRAESLPLRLVSGGH